MTDITSKQGEISQYSDSYFNKIKSSLKIYSEMIYFISLYIYLREYVYIQEVQQKPV